MFRDPQTTEFVIVTVPTQMAVAESRRLCRSLRTEGVPVRRIVVNQKIPANATEQFINMKVPLDGSSLRSWVTLNSSSI